MANCLLLRKQTGILKKAIFFSVRKQTVSLKSYNQVCSGIGQKFIISDHGHHRSPKRTIRVCTALQVDRKLDDNILSKTHKNYCKV